MVSFGHVGEGTCGESNIGSANQHRGDLFDASRGCDSLSWSLHGTRQ